MYASQGESLLSLGCLHFPQGNPGRVVPQHGSTATNKRLLNQVPASSADAFGGPSSGCYRFKNGPVSAVPQPNGHWLCHSGYMFASNSTSSTLLSFVCVCSNMFYILLVFAFY